MVTDVNGSDTPTLPIELAKQALFFLTFYSNSKISNQSYKYIFDI